MSASTDDVPRIDVPSLPPVHESWLPAEHPMHRPRHSPRQRAAAICSVVFFATPLLLLLLGVRVPAFENRELASFPSISDGWGFLPNFSPWAADHLPLRDRAVAAAEAISRTVFREPMPLGQQTKQGQLQGPVAQDPSEEDRERVRQAGFPRVIEGKDGWLYLGYDMLGACLPERPLDDTIGALRRLRSAVESSGRRFVLLVTPDKTTMVPEYLPTIYVGSRCSSEVKEAFWTRIVSENGALDIRPALRAAAERQGAPVYSRVDSHWTYEGGLAMTSMVADKIEPGITESWRATSAGVVRQEGDLPPLIGHTAEYSLQTYDLAPDGVTVLSRPISEDFRSPVHLTQPVSNAVVNSPVGMIADSNTTFAMPYLAGGFADLTVLHSDTVGADSRSAGALFANKDVIVMQAVERSLVGGIHPVLTNEAIAAFGAELAKHPRG